MPKVTQTGHPGFDLDMPRETKTTIYVVLGWLLMVLGLVLLLGCTPQNTKPMTYADTITAAEELVITAANTLADAADAGMISRESETYQGLKEAIIEASHMVRFSWAAYLDGNQDEAEQWRQAVIGLYGQIRPALAEITKEPPQ